MAQRKREFDSVREMWEAKACSPGAVLPSPSPSKRFAKLSHPEAETDQEPALLPVSAVASYTSRFHFTPQRGLWQTPAAAASVGRGEPRRDDGRQSPTESIQIDVESAVEVEAREGKSPAPQRSQQSTPRTPSSPLKGSPPVAAAAGSARWSASRAAEEETSSGADAETAAEEELVADVLPSPETTDDESTGADEDQPSLPVPLPATHPVQHHDVLTDTAAGASASSPGMSERGIDLHVLDEEAVRVRGVLVGEQSRVSNNSLPPSSADADQPASIPTVPASAPSPIRSRSPDIPPLDLSQALDDPHPVGNVKDVAESSPLLMGLRQHITDLEAEAEYQETVADQIRRTISAAQKGSAQTSTDRSIISARVEAERTLLIAARKRKGCLAQARRIQRAIDQLRSAGSDPLTIQPLQDPSYSAALTFRGFQLDVSSDFLADLKADTTAEYFVVIVLMLLEQVHATEALPLSEFDARGRLLLSNLIQFVDVQCGFMLEVEATLIRVGRQHAPLHPAASAPSSHSTPTHGGNFLKRVMAALPKSANKHADASAGSHSAVGFRASVNPASSELANVMSLGSVTLNVDNYNRKRHVLSEALLVKECGVVLDTEVMLDLEINVPLAAFLTFYCFHDPGSQTEWIRRWCVLRGSTLLMWRYPDDVDKGVNPLSKLEVRDALEGSLRRANSQECARPHCFLLRSERAVFAAAPLDTTPAATAGMQTRQPILEYFVAADDKAQLAVCLRQLGAARTALQHWRLTCDAAGDVVSV